MRVAAEQVLCVRREDIFPDGAWHGFVSENLDRHLGRFGLEDGARHDRFEALESGAKPERACDAVEGGHLREDLVPALQRLEFRRVQRAFAGKSRRGQEVGKGACPLRGVPALTGRLLA